MSERQGDWIPFGKHRYRFEGTDIMHSVSNGAVSGAETKLLCELMQQRSAEIGAKIYWLVDMTRSVPMSPETRAETAKLDSSAYMGCMVGYGASLATRTVINLTIRAMSLLRPGFKMPPVQMSATEAEARAFIEEIRRGGKP